MAKDKDKGKEEGTQEEGGSRGSAIVFPHPDTGLEVKRVDFIRERFAKGKAKEDSNGPAYPASPPPNSEEKSTRGAIAKELSKIQGKKVPYQIVFQATKEKKEKDKPSTSSSSSSGSAGEQPSDGPAAA